jgi:arylsulfatase A-like enzyme
MEAGATMRGGDAASRARSFAPVAVLLCGLALLAEAALRVRNDGYLDAGLRDLAWNALSRHLDDAIEGAPWFMVFSILLMAALAWREVRSGAPAGARVAAGVARVFLGIGAWLLASGHLGPGRPAAPSLGDGPGLAANGVLLALWIAIAWVAHALFCRLPPRGLSATAAMLVALLAVAAPLAFAMRDTSIRDRSGERLSVAILSIDTLRADRLGCYGSPRGATPTLDRLAEQSVRFEAALSPYPFTLTAHASMFTGLDPAAHGAIPLGPRVDERMPLFSDVPTLAEAFRDAGYVTVGVVDSCLWMQRGYGLERGFQVWRTVSGDLAAKTQVLKDVLRDLGERPAFLFLHCFDVHSDHRRLPYEAAEEDRGTYTRWYRGDFTGAEPPGATDADHRASGLLRTWNNQRADVPDEVVRYISDLYDEGVCSADRMLANAIDLLDRAEFRARGALLVTSDHGEEFREHGRFMHDAQLYEESVRVPFLLRLWKQLPEGRTITDPISLIDVAPTLAELAGVNLPAAQGCSVLGLLEGESEPRPVFLGAKPGEDGVRHGRFKLIRKGESIEVRRREADPGEQGSDARARPDGERAHRHRRDERRRQNEELAASRRRGGDLSIPASQLDRMNQIGY